MEVMKRNLLKVAWYKECVVEIARAMKNILKALDIAEGAMLTLKKLTKIIREKKSWLRVKRKGTSARHY